MAPRVRLAAFVTVTVYLGFVAWLTLRPVTAVWVSPPNVELFATIRSDLARGPGEAARSLGAGLALLAPLGVLLPVLGKRLGGSRFASAARTVFAGAMISLVIELLQSSVPGRVANIDALLLSTLGVGLVHLLAYAPLRSLLLRPRRPSVPRPVPRPQAISPGPTPRASGVSLAPRADARAGRLSVR
ncbi:VanZ family protein [Streptomyces sp. ACA25]|uniref:VanZ family protein n=1 Tax=Streptomyces sp. ACA25 TaxID=3022596 RepID=UPI0023075058|nr:VanZ family protein [Streptomyces sp. ACA25]MDB1087048.1 VanZ family protein [Streptomyces sp. ACA25]